VPFDREVVDPLLIIDERPAGHVLPKRGQESVVIAAPATQAKASVIEREARDEYPIDRSGFDRTTPRRRLGNAHRARDQVRVEVLDTEQFQPMRSPIDSGTDQRLTKFQSRP
jgi:hypothetical protein